MRQKPRPIMDYTFYGTNQACVPITPSAAMQFGSTLQHILQRLAYCNADHGLPLMAKVDLADGFYQVPLSPDAALSLAIIIPSDIPSFQSLIALLLMLPMGWTHSPPYFCTYTEAITDLANTTTPITADQPTLQLTQSVSLPRAQHFHPNAVTPGKSSDPRLSHIDVYMDDFMVIAQAPAHIPAMNHLLHSIDSVLIEPQVTNRRPVVSTSKIAKGDASFSTCKSILGWDVNSETMTITLPEHHLKSMK
jgi:hypothetical protein